MTDRRVDDDAIRRTETSADMFQMINDFLLRDSNALGKFPGGHRGLFEFGYETLTNCHGHCLLCFRAPDSK